MLSYGFYNSKGGDRRYDAEQFGAMFNGLITDGVFAHYKDALKVTAGSGNRELVVKPGRAWFNGTWTEIDDNGHNIYLMGSAVETTYFVYLAVNKLDRKNSIAWYSNIANNDPEKGLYFYLLAQVTVPGGVTKISDSMITDTRGSDLCPYVTGIMETVSFEEIVKRVCGDSWQDWLGVYEAGITTGVQNAVAASERALDEVKSMKAYAVESEAASYIWAKFEAVPTGGGGFEWATDSVHTELADPPMPVCLFRDLSYADLGAGFKPSISLGSPYKPDGETTTKPVPASTQAKVWKEYPYFWEGGGEYGTEVLRYDDLQRIIITSAGVATEKCRYRISRLAHLPVTYEPGAYMGTVTADNATAYPRDGYKDGYWYMRFAAKAEDVSFYYPGLSAKTVRDAIIEVVKTGGGAAMSVIEVEELPATGVSGVMYVVKKSGDSDAVEYLWLDRWEQIGGTGSGQNSDPAGTAASVVAAHNGSVEAHPDIRETVNALAEVAGVNVRPRPIVVTLDTVGKNAGSLALDGSVASGSIYYSDLIATGGRCRLAIYNASSSITVNFPLIFYAEDGSEVLRKTWRVSPQSTTEIVVGFECAHLRINGTNGFVFGANYTITMSSGAAAATENLYDPRTGLIGGLIDASTGPVGKHVSAFLGNRHPSLWTILFPNRGPGTYTLASEAVTSIPVSIEVDKAGYITALNSGIISGVTVQQTATRKFVEFALGETDAAYIGLRVTTAQYSDDLMIYQGAAEMYPGGYVSAMQPGSANPIITAANLRADLADYHSGALTPYDDAARQTARLATAINSAQFVRENREYNIQLTDYFSHEGNIQIDADGIAYVVHTSNEASGYDGADDINLKIELAVVDLEAGTILSQHVVAKHGDAVGDVTITSGLGAPNIALLDSGIVRMIFSAQLAAGGPWYSIYRDYDPTAGTLGNIGKCQLSVDGVAYDLTTATINEHITAVPNTTKSCVHHNSQWVRHTDGFYYLFVACDSYIKYGIIMRTLDFITFEEWTIPEVSESITAEYEGQLCILDGYMYLALRIGDLTRLLLEKISMAEKKVVNTRFVPDCNARSWWFIDGGMPYLIHGMDNRGRTDIVKIAHQPNSSLNMGGIVCQGNDHVYPSVQRYGDWYYMASRINGHVCVTRFRLPWRTSGTVESGLLKLCELMEL